MAERVGDHTALVAALRARQLVRGGPDGAAERLTLGVRLLGAGEEAGDDDAVLWGRLWRVDALAQLGDLDRAEAELGPLGVVAERLRSPLADWQLLRCRGAVAVARGRFDNAVTFAQEQIALIRRTGHQGAMGRSIGLLQVICSLTGATELPVDDPPEPAAASPLPGLVGVWYLASGRREDARQVYASLPPEAEVADFILLSHLAGVVELAAAFGDATRCAEVYQRLRPYAELFVCSGAGVIAITGSVCLPLGVAAAGAGRLDDAVTHLRAAIEANDHAGLPPFAAIARYQLGQVLARRRRTGDREEAAALAASAAAVAQRLGMAPLLHSARELSAEVAGRMAGPLTAREREIAVLVSHGLTNRQIAAARHISLRTAEAHVQHILTKLGFTTRSQIAAWVATRADEYRG